MTTSLFITSPRTKHEERDSKCYFLCENKYKGKHRGGDEKIETFLFFLVYIVRFERMDELKLLEDSFNRTLEVRKQLVGYETPVLRTLHRA